MNESEARRLIASSPPGEFATTLRTVLRDLPGGAKLSLRQAAQLGGMSVRSLQRQLGAEGCSFTELSEELRVEMAIEMLRDSEMPLDQIAQTLGYSKVSNFNRAFLRWTGKSPSDFKR